jgi:lincosamide nucleotidyltransferase A/C/D/E
MIIEEKFGKAMMPADHVVEIYDLLKSHGIKIWIDGGWGVDALLEKQTREHGDLDIAIQEHDLSKTSSAW